ncbi:MAG: hypothetical protein VX000_06865, partial [Myxococcota bacterium]|nr:hypothetical protein [Myxococcota bacterium]
SGFDEWATAQRKTVTGQYLRVQRHVDLVQDDFGGVFSGALQRALESDGALLEECSKGSGVQALMRRQAADCPGDDRSGTLAAALDADKTLQTSVAEILAIPFPELGIEGRAWAPATITGTARWVSADALARRFASSALDRQTESLANRLAPLEARIAGGDAAAVEEAAVARAAYEAALAAMGDTVLGAAAPALQKAGMGDVGACANPTSFGGCTGADATREVLDVLSADRRFIKATDSL